ncbi:MAG TPA: response regulator [Roseiflexaceae bacterium]|nr:response regulator [Roseiflexaceae bacterium]
MTTPNHHILVFNDTQVILDLFVEILTDAGYRVTARTYGTQDLTAVEEHLPDLVIADYPPVDREERGWQLVQMLRMSRTTEHIPIVVCTTNLKAVQATEGWLATKNILAIPKPFSIDELLDAVRHQLSGSPRSDQQDSAREA